METVRGGFYVMATQPLPVFPRLSEMLSSAIIIDLVERVSAHVCL